METNAKLKVDAQVKDNDMATDNFLVGRKVKARAKVKTNAKLKVEATVKGNDMTIDNSLVGG